MNVNEIAKTIKTRRKQRKLTQQELAEMLGCGVNFIKAVEAGKTNLQLQRYLDLLDFLGIEINSNS